MIFKISSHDFQMSQFVDDHSKIPEFLQVSYQHFLKIKPVTEVSIFVTFKKFISDCIHLMYLYVTTNSTCTAYYTFCNVILYMLYIL